MMIDLFLKILENVSFFFAHNLLCSVILIVILFIYFCWFYSRVTLGVYNDEQDMTGKTVLITGASDGVGKTTAYDLARRNARVLLACRNEEKANKVAEEIKLSTGNQNIIVKNLNLASFDSVRKCARNVLDTEDELHVLINNAGASALPGTITEDGCEILMQTNYLGHFLLTLLLLDLLKKSSPSRIINVSSIVHYLAKLDLNNLKNEMNLSSSIVYRNSKLANILFTRELAERLAGTGVTVNALHPGYVKSAIFRNTKGLMSLVIAFTLAIVGKTEEEGAYTTIRLAVDPTLEKITGKYFMDCKEARTSSKANNKELAKGLFELSEQIVGLRE